MTARQVVRRRRATLDGEEASFFYKTSASERVALDFSGALESAYEFIAGNPAAGSRRYADLLNLPGIRTWGLRGFPYIVFYVDSGNTIESGAFCMPTATSAIYSAARQPRPL